MMNWKDDYNLLRLGRLTSLVTGINFSRWGNQVSVQCVYNPEKRLPYVMLFKDCRNVSWDIYDPEEVNEMEAELLGISLGEDAHRQPAVITTDIFEISILYGSFSLSQISNCPHGEAIGITNVMMKHWKSLEGKEGENPSLAKSVELEPKIVLITNLEKLPKRDDIPIKAPYSNARLRLSTT